MRYPADRKEKTRAGLVAIAGRVFRRTGFDGVGVDALAAEAGLTSGALYKHFATKRAVFRAVVEAGVQRLAAGITRFQEQSGREWLAELARWYLGPEHQADVAGGCLLPSLTPEVVKADDETRETYQQGLLAAMDALMSQRPFRDAVDGRERAWATLALLAGGVSLARAVPDPALANEIAEAVRSTIGRRGPSAARSGSAKGSTR